MFSVSRTEEKMPSKIKSPYCSKCGDEVVYLPSKQGLKRRCLRCRAEGQKGYTLQRKFGITMEEYLRLRKKQKKRCAICRKPYSTKQEMLSVDHNHETGQVRGLLCGSCNRGLGLFTDNPKALRRAARYLEANGNV